MSLLRLLPLALCLALLTSPLGVEDARAQAPERAVEVKVGGRQSVSVANVARVAVGDPDVADIRVGAGDQIEITGRASGSTQLLVWRQDGQRLSFQITVTQR